MITQLLFQPFQPGLSVVEKVDQPNHPEMVFPQKTQPAGNG